MGNSIHVHPESVATNPDFVTGTPVGNKLAMDVIVLAGGSGGGAEAAVGSGGYTTGSNDFTATPTAGTKDVVIVGLNFTLTSCSIIGGSATVKSSLGVVSAIPMTNIAVTDSTITFADKTANFAVGDTVCMSLDGPDKAYVAASNSNSVTETSSLDTKYIIEQFTLTNVPNAGGGDVSALIDMNGYGPCSVQVVKNGGVDTFAWTMESSTEGVSGGATYDDTTQFGFTSVTATNAATYAAGGQLHSVKGYTPQSHRVRIVTAGGNDDANFTITFKKQVLN